MDQLRVVKTELGREIRSLIDDIRLCIGQKDDGRSRRTSHRFTYTLPLRIEYVDRFSLRKLVEASMCNISAAGLCFLSMHEFEPGQKVTLTMETEWQRYRIPSTVIHSTFCKGGCRTGVRFDLDEE